MKQNQVEILILEVIEKKLGFEFENKQLDFIFNNKKNLLYTAPRGYGKDLITAVRAIIKSISTPRKRTAVIVGSEMQKKMIHNLIVETIGEDLIAINNTASSCYMIRLNNDSIIQIINGSHIENMRGFRVDEVIISEPFSFNSNKLDEIITRANAIMAHQNKPSLLLIGTPALSNETFNRLLVSPYWDRISVTINDVSRLQSLRSLRTELDEETFRREILGEFNMIRSES